MKRLLLAVALSAVVSSSSGCCLFDWIFGHCGPAACCGRCGPYPGGCGSCGSHGGGCGAGDCSPGCARGAGDGGIADGSEFAGPPTGGVTYPYYTTRGPRDYLARSPRGIGP